MINVTKSYLPPLEKYVSYLKVIWENGWLTNNGPLLQDLEGRLKEYLGVKHCFVCSNGTIALQIAIRALELKGEIITTPYSYVASLNSILWENCKPVFADINSRDFNIDPQKVEACVSPDTSAILATHVYGNPCDVKKLKQIADAHSIKVIYDGAHVFGAKYEGNSILGYGDIATCSLHATKLFHTVEGGLIITHDDSIARKIFLMRQFGHEGETYYGLGINGKNSEFHAAMGLSILPDLDEILQQRKQVILWYNRYLDLDKLVVPKPLEGTTSNYSFYPVILPSEKILLQVKANLLKEGINPRRYFFPSLNVLPHVHGQPCKVSEFTAQRAMSLPLFVGLAEDDVKRIAQIINRELP